MSMKLRVQTEKIDLAEELLEEFRAPARAAARKAGDLYLEELESNLQKVAGRVSRPGEPPATQSGELLRSFSRSGARIGRDKASVSVQIESTEPYEKLNALEYGSTGPRGVRILPRPYRRPTDEVVEPKIDELFEGALG